MSKTPEHDTPENEAPADDVDTSSAETETEAGEAEADAPAEPTLEDQLAKTKDQLLRSLAEAENTRKRAARDVKDAREYAIAGFARDMLDVADNFARALAAVDEDARANAGPALAALLEGVEMTEKRLHASLERHGVKKVDPEPGDPLDPNRHQAAAQVPADQPKNTIAHVMQPGYVIGERTLRAAMVVVSAGPAEGAAPKSNGSGGEGGGDAKPGDGVDVSA
jgi:molecular chaperone GrpE